MNKEQFIRFGVGFALVTLPVFILGCLNGEWLRGARIAMDISLWVSSTAILFAMLKWVWGIIATLRNREPG